MTYDKIPEMIPSILYSTMVMLYSEPEVRKKDFERDTKTELNVSERIQKIHKHLFGDYVKGE